jgi:hypothetical protein
MQQLAGLLTEVHIQPAGTLPYDLHKILMRLKPYIDTSFGSGSPDDDEPLEEYVASNIESEELSKDDKSALKKYIGKKLVTDGKIFSEVMIPSPQQPKGAFTACVEVVPDPYNEIGILVSVPNIDEEAVNTGWFNRQGEYISTATYDDINEVNIAPSNIPRFTTGRTPMYGDVPDWDQTPDNDNVRYIDHINYNSPKYDTIIYGHEQTDDMLVEPKNPNPIIFGIVGGEQGEVFEEMVKYLQSNGIQYNMENFEDEELYLSVSLDDLKKKQLFRK